MLLPSGTVTFLFTDIEGSTRLWEHHPDAMRVALARHDELLRRIIQDNSGIVFKTIGDAFCAAFATAPDALMAALAAQCALQAEPWPDALALRVRMALHTGAAELRDNDYFGQSLNRIARLLAIGHGGQVLVSGVTQELIRDLLPENSRLQDIGEHRLRDLARPEHVYQLLHPILPAQFPPLKSLNSPDLPNNLPQQVSSFIGRAKEIADVKRLLGTTRLLTLTGSGGCGKTRLGLQVAAEVLEHYPQGVWLVELAALAEPALVPQTVAQVFKVTEEPGRPLVQMLVEALKPQRLLLILDNCEHVLDACVRLTDTLLRNCPHVRVMASSREGLGIGGETLYRIPSLSLPDPRQHSTPASLIVFEAARLFVERATAALPAFVVTNANAPALASVCHRLDGIPLAIELAAARVRSLSVEELNARLDNRFRLLTGGSRTALPRQQTLRALIDWSYDLLTLQERALLGRLSVFAGGWTLEAAEAVGAGADVDEWEVLDLLTSLVDKSLVVSEPHTDRMRYHLLETVRQYARDRLVESGEGDSVRGRHQAFFLALAEEAEPQLSGSDGAQWLDHLEGEYDNLRSALEWGTNGPDDNPDNAEVAVRIAGALFRFWEVRGYYTEGRQWLARVLADTHPRAGTPAQAKALDAAGALARSQSDYSAAHDLHQRSLAINQQLGNKQGIARSLLSLGNIAFEQGDYATATPLYERSLALNQEVGNKRGTASALMNLGHVTYEQGNHAGALPIFELCLTLYQELGNKRGMAHALGNLGNIASEQGDVRTTQALLEQGLTLYQELGDKQGTATFLLKRGSIAAEQGDYAAARSYYEQGLNLFHEAGDKRGIAFTLETFAAMVFTQGQVPRAAHLWGAAEGLREAIGVPRQPSERPRYDQQVAQARAALSEDIFAVAWERGRTMTMEQAIAVALADAASCLSGLGEPES